MSIKILFNDVNFKHRLRFLFKKLGTHYSDSSDCVLRSSFWWDSLICLPRYAWWCMSTECSWGSQRYLIVKQSCYRTMPAFSASRNSSAFLFRGCSILHCKLHGAWQPGATLSMEALLFVLTELVISPVVVGILRLWKMSGIRLIVNIWGHVFSPQVEILQCW